MIWGLGDVLSDVMNTDLYKYSHNPMIHVHSKSNDDIFIRYLVIMKKYSRFINKGIYRGLSLRPPCDVINGVMITMKMKYIPDISEVKLKLRLIL